MEGTTIPSRCRWGDTGLPISKERFLRRTHSVVIWQRKLELIFDVPSLCEVVYAEISRVVNNPLVHENVHLILPSCTVSSLSKDILHFEKTVDENLYLWRRWLRERIGNRGVEKIEKSLGKPIKRLFFEGVMVVDQRVQEGTVLSIVRGLKEHEQATSY
jgi:hypothetical protein